jgi:tetratricopeptide (TPR) repeat protein
MIITSDVSAEKEQFVSSPPEFQLEPPGKNPFEAVPATSVVRSTDSFDMNWVENPIEPGLSKTEEIFDAILSRSRRDVERFPSDPQAHANYAVALMNRGNLDAAADEFSIAVNLFPRHFMSLANLARIRAMQERFKEAEQLYENLASLYPRELSPLVNWSYVLFRTNQLDKATSVLKRAIEIDREAAFPRYLMAVSQLKLQRPHEAIKHLRVAVRADVRSPVAYQALGVAYVMAGDTKAAVRSFKTALALAPDMKEGVQSLANVLLQRGETDDLIEVVSTYLQRNSADIKAREILSEAYSQNKQYSQARLQLTTALRYVVGDSDEDRKVRAKLLNNIGVCFDRQGDADNTMHWVQRSLAVEQKFDAIPHLNLARLQLRRRQLAQAWRTLETCKELFPDNHELPVVQAAVLVEQDRYDEAIDLLRVEIASGNAYATSYAYIGSYLMEYKDGLDEACQIMYDGLDRYPQSSEITNNLAYVLLMSGRPAEARKALMSLPLAEKKIRPENRMALTATWGLLYLWEDDIAMGERYYKHAEEIARELRRNDLVATVRQKMHLELAKAFLRQDALVEAKEEIARGLSVEGGRIAFEKELQSLDEQLESNPGG